MWEFSSDKWRSVREMKGLKQADMARILRVSRQTVSSIEEGNHKPTVKLMVKCASLFGVEAGPSYFFVNKGNNDCSPREAGDDA